MTLRRPIGYRRAMSGCPTLLLASGSATRLSLLRAAGMDVEARPAAIDEGEIKRSARAAGVSAEDTALLLAELKALPTARASPEAVVIGADQLLVCGDRWFDKPNSLAEARSQLLALRGQTHTLVTAVVVHRGGHRVWRHVAKPRLTMRAFGDAFLDDYLSREGVLVLTTVGGFRLEGLGVQLFDSVVGEHAAILGLPLLPLLGYLREAGVLLT